MTSSLLLDTDVVSFLFKADSRATLYLPHLVGHTRVISFMTLAELDRWVLERNWGAQRRASLETYLQKLVVYPYSRSLCREWAKVSDDALTVSIGLVGDCQFN